MFVAVFMFASPSELRYVYEDLLFYIVDCFHLQASFGLLFVSLSPPLAESYFPCSLLAFLLVCFLLTFAL